MRRRSASPYLRREATREPYDTVLLVCEGEKTEPSYFNDLKAAYRLSSANIVVVSPGADPLTLVQYARGRLSEFNKVFCIFDGENTARAVQAVGSISSSDEGRVGKWCAVVSTPCFEIWPLLHFKFSTAPFGGRGGMTAGEAVVSALREHMPEYRKGMRGLYGLLSGNMTLGSANGRRLEKHNRASQSTNPSTQMHTLVEYLKGLKR